MAKPIGKKRNKAHAAKRGAKVDKALKTGPTHTEDSRIAGMHKPRPPAGLEHVARSRHWQ